MRRTSTWLLFSVLGWLAAGGCAPQQDSGVGTAVPGWSRHPIVNGTRDPQAVALTEAQIRSIGWLYYTGYSSQIFCTGTLIGPDLVVTARHCVNGVAAGEVGFGVGMEPRSPEDLFVSIGVFPNPEVDAALIRLGEDVTASGLDITPIPVSQVAVSSTAVGRAVQAGGYGETYDSSRTGRWFATVYIESVLSDEIVVDGRGDQGICYGDSGSGLIDLDANGDPVVLAVESWGDPSCVDIDHMTRLDPIWDWIGPVLDGVDPPDPCEGVGSEGRCLDNVAQLCRNASLRETDCTALGTECAYIEEAERYACLCGDLDEVGRCHGDALEYCRDGRLSVRDCGRWGGTCGWDEADGSYNCVDNPVCRPEDEAGRCDGDVAIRCVAGRTTREICPVEGNVCVTTEVGVACEPPASTPDAGPAGQQSTGDEREEKVAGGGGISCAVSSLAGAPLSALGLLLLAVRRRRRC